MPKYIKKRRSPKKHEFFNGIEHKYCGTCSPPQWKPLDQFAKKGDGKQSSCKSCKKKYDKERRKVASEKRKQARDEAPGFLVCLNVCCTVKGLQPMDQFIGAHVRNDEPTMNCLNCRDKKREAQKRRRAACEKVYQNWRKTHPCVKCMNDPNYEHNYLLIEADHLPEFEKVEACSQIGFWSHSQRGVRLLKAELKKCQATCKFHHALVTQQRNHDNGRIEKKPWVLRKRRIINAEKYKRGCCFLCKRVVKEGEECAFHFDHRDPSTKFMYNGKAKNPSHFAYLSDALFDKQWPLEQAKCDLLCTNCHALKDNRDGYRK